jgi:hypothetical protein
LRLDQTTQGDFSRLRFLSSTNAYWDVAVGGGAANVMNWFVSGIGNLMTLQPGGNLGILGTVSADSFAGNGLVGWQVPAGTSIQTQPNSGYLLTNASQVTVTLPTSPAISDIVRVSGGGAGGWRLAQNASQSVMGNFLKSGGAISTNWVEGGTNKNISLLGVASSADGSKLIIAGYPGLYTSTNSGLTWKSNNAPVQSWGVVASSADGTKLVATTGNGVQAPIYTSTDSGATWTPRTVSRFWSSIASSTNGIKLVATDDLGTGSGGQIYTSTNSGVTWTPYGVNTNWAAVASSADGNKLVAVVAGGGIWVSSDSGVTWTETSSVATDWFAVCCSADGTIILAAAAGVYDGYLAYSHDSGGTWFNPKPLQLATWYAVACSADGTKQAAVEYGSGIWTSSDSGLTWTQTGQNAGGHRWTGVASSADGTKLIAVEHDTHTVWLSQPALQTITSTGPAGFLAGGHGTAAELQYIGNNQFMQISHQGTVLAY